MAISQVFGSALQGRCKDRPELAATPIPLSARIDVLPVRGGERFLRAVFEPLGYAVEADRHPLDERFPEWGESPYFSVTVAQDDDALGAADAPVRPDPGLRQPEALLRRRRRDGEAAGQGRGLAGRPPREGGDRPPLPEVPAEPLPAGPRPARRRRSSRSKPRRTTRPAEQAEDVLEKPLSLNEQRLGAVMAALRASGARRVLDLGCGEGKLLRELLKDRQFEEIVGMDVSIRSLEAAQRPAEAGPAARRRRPTGSS